MIADGLGTREARKQQEYLISASKPDVVILRIYGDTAVCAYYDSATKVVKKSFEFEV